MSLTIIKGGILDTIQDQGRFGYQHKGINPTGAIDRFSFKLSNCLLGKEMDEACIEMHFPAAVIQFNIATIICITGADFSPTIDKISIPLNQPVAVSAGAILQFTKVRSGVRCYLSIYNNLNLKKWLGSYSTNIKASAGGFEGRALKTGDVIGLRENDAINHYLEEKKFRVLSWKALPARETSTKHIECIEGSEWDWLTEESKQVFTENQFMVTNVADRMGYRLKGLELKLKEQKQLVSSGVTFGTMQLLPNEQLIVLMADHQTTGGYPRIANVISAHLPALAQMAPGTKLTFKMTDINRAEQQILQQHQYLLSVQYASSFNIEKLLHDL
ncbi:biotin-dependent carboxyltransferase family protein [Segetibacter aerophilus]|uniref:KipI antagonist n=1 Tax=Segetibacter aerophilus TaxID=670293 RepID=A0A512BHQ5_9BACT|nr:biotin-dependent carboxyltransferase family protein [Segetibacter aerophilus]GEO11504.1 KipI antagonist [Segetibacter aerophilus]